MRFTRIMFVISMSMVAGLVACDTLTSPAPAKVTQLQPERAVAAQQVTVTINGAQVPCTSTTNSTGGTDLNCNTTVVSAVVSESSATKVAPKSTRKKAPAAAPVEEERNCSSFGLTHEEVLQCTCPHTLDEYADLSASAKRECGPYVSF